MKLLIETRRLHERETLLTLSGEIDYETAQDLRTAVTSALAGRVDTLVINLAGVVFLDSTGIGTLVVAKRICHGMGVTVHLRQPSPFIVQLFSVLGVTDILGVRAAVGGVPVGNVPVGRVPAGGVPARLTR